MDSSDTNLAEATLARPGLRERKKQQTREKIAHVALKLFAERGYDHTTLAEIAEAADVSPRTIFAYFESKEDILFCDERASQLRLEQILDQRPPGTTTVDALREYLSGFGQPDEEALLRKRILRENEALRLAGRARDAWVEQLIARSIARDLGDVGPDDLRPVLIAASVTAAFNTVRDRLVQKGPTEQMTHEEGLQILDNVVEFLRGGLEALQHAQ
jgi:AcrR family transcriptional regulator